MAEHTRAESSVGSMMRFLSRIQFLIGRSRPLVECLTERAVLVSYLAKTLFVESYCQGDYILTNRKVKSWAYPLEVVSQRCQGWGEGFVCL